VPTSIFEHRYVETGASIQAYYNGYELVVSENMLNGTFGEVSIEVYNLYGQLLVSERYSESGIHYLPFYAAPGIYIVKAYSDGSKSGVVKLKIQ
jgi:hypothetical protein